MAGDFEAEKNYLDFESVDECMANVEKLFNDPDSVYEMKRRNAKLGIASLCVGGGMGAAVLIENL